MSRRGIGTLASRTISRAWNDRILGLSAEAAFWQLLSLPSLFLALLAALGYFSEWAGEGTVDRVQQNLLTAFSRAFSPQVVDQTIAPVVQQVLREGRADVISVGFLLALWAGSSATATFVNTITIAYGMRDLRGAVRSRLLALGIYLGSIVVGVIVLPALVLGPTVLPKLFPEGARRTADRVISDAYWPTVLLLLLVGLTSLYHLAPPRRLPWRRGVPGALLAMVIFLGGAAGAALLHQLHHRPEPRLRHARGTDRGPAVLLPAGAGGAAGCGTQRRDRAALAHHHGQGARHQPGLEALHAQSGARTARGHRALSRAGARPAGSGRATRRQRLIDLLAAGAHR